MIPKRGALAKPVAHEEEELLWGSDSATPAVRHTGNPIGSFVLDFQNLIDREKLRMFCSIII